MYALEGSLGYIERFCLKNNNNNKKEVQEAQLAEKYNYQRRIPLERAESAGEEGRGCAWHVTSVLVSTHKRQL